MVIDRENGRGVPPDRGVLITIVTSTLPSLSVASYMVELNPTVIGPVVESEKQTSLHKQT